ncbi:cupin domain-containing protein [Candidatus Woesearchaeota archaeon]|nr:cupin domain-containing protein [Candidatus Woesearchaeota archaeon]
MINTKKIRWSFERKNVLSKHLARDNSRNLQLDMVKLKPNIKYLEHKHPDIEWVYVLRGSMGDENGVYREGHFIINKKGSKHSVTSGPKGCVLLVVWCGELE